MLCAIFLKTILQFTMSKNKYLNNNLFCDTKSKIRSSNQIFKTIKETVEKLSDDIKTNTGMHPVN